MRPSTWSLPPSSLPPSSPPALVVRLALVLVLPFAFAATAPLVAQAVPPAPPADPPVATRPPTPLDEEVDAAILLLPAHDGEVWVELTPRDAAVAPRLLAGRGTADDGMRRLDTGLAELAVLVCRGGDGLGTACEDVFLAAGSTTVLGLPGGSAVTGVLYLDREVVAGASVAAVPADLDLETPFTVPLARRGGELVRTVETGDDGGFRLPPLAAGRYFLEIAVPGGGLHRSDVFALPAPSAVAREVGRDVDGSPLWPLGTIDLQGGATLEVLATDAAGEPLRAVEVRVLQGTVASDLATFVGETGADGRVELRGIDVTRPGEVSCRRRGRDVWLQRYELIPGRVECVLPLLSAVTGRLLTGEEETVATGAAVALRSLAGETARRVGAADATGRFTLTDVAAGEHELIAGAPGFRALRRTFAVEAGEILDLGDLLLLPGLTLAGVVVDATSDEPIPGVEIVAVEPPGMVRTETDAAGAFTLIGGDVRLLLLLRSPRHAERRILVAPERFESSAPLRVELVPGGFLEVAIVDADSGRPCSDCKVRISPDGLELWTDARGIARSPALRPGPYRVYRPRSVHLGSTVVEEGDAESRAAEVRAGEVTRVVFGESRRPLRVRLVPAPGSGHFLSARAGDRVERLQPQADGSFLVAHRPGEALLLRLHRWDAGAAGERFTAIAEVPAVVEGDELVLRLPSTRVEAEIRDADGDAVAGQPVTLRSLVHGNVEAAVAFSDADGEVAIEHLLPGVYAFYLGDRPVQNLSLWEGGVLDLMTFTVP